MYQTTIGHLVGNTNPTDSVNSKQTTFSCIFQNSLCLQLNRRHNKTFLFLLNDDGNYLLLNETTEIKMLFMKEREKVNSDNVGKLIRHKLHPDIRGRN